jgi:hypothetical protein
MPPSIILVVETLLFLRISRSLIDGGYKDSIMLLDAAASRYNLSVPSRSIGTNEKRYTDVRRDTIAVRMLTME